MMLMMIILFFVVVWFGVSLRHWRKLLAIQNWIAGVIFLGMAESATLYFDALEVRASFVDARALLTMCVCVAVYA